VSIYICIDVLLLLLLFGYSKQEKSQLFPVIVVFSQNG